MKKSRPKPKPRPDILLIPSLLLIFQFSCGLCRLPLMPHQDAVNKENPSPDAMINTPEAELVHPLPGATDNITFRRYPIDEFHQVSLGDQSSSAFKDYRSSRDGDVALDVAENNDTSLQAGYDRRRDVMTENEVWSLVEVAVANRNHIRVRRQRSPSVAPRRRRKQTHRLLLKPRAEKHGRKGKKERKDFIINSDSEGHVIMSASKVKKDWCHTVPFMHKVMAPGCSTKIISNHFCYGQCNSFFVPHELTQQGEVFQSFSNCKPDRLVRTNVTLDCPNQNPPTVQKEVLMVESCRCMATIEAKDKKPHKHIRHKSHHSNKRRSRLVKNHKVHS